MNYTFTWECPDSSLYYYYVYCSLFVYYSYIFYFGLFIENILIKTVLYNYIYKIYSGFHQVVKC